MRYLLMIYEEPPATPPTDEEWAAMMPEYNAFGAWAAEKGWMLGGEALQGRPLARPEPSATAGTKGDRHERVEDGRPEGSRQGSPRQPHR